MRHIFVVLTVAVFFIITQLYLCVAITRKRNKYLDSLKQLADRTVRSGSDVNVQWFDLFFNSIRNSSLLVCAKDSAIQHAEDQVYSLGEYAILQRLGTIAPLIGVILTAVGFLTIENALSDISSFGPPLAAGVLAGAVLSVINQGFLVKAEADLQLCMQESRKLIDFFWQQQASKLVDANAHLLKVATSFDSTVNRLGAIIDEFPSDVSALNTKFSNIATIATSTYASISKHFRSRPSLRRGDVLLTAFNSRSSLSWLVRFKRSVRVLSHYHRLLGASRPLRLICAVSRSNLSQPATHSLSS